MSEIRWRAIYHDSSILPQYHKCGFQLGYENIDRTKLAAFDIYEIEEKDKYTVHTLETGKLIFRMFLDKGQKLIYRRRRRKDLGTNQIVFDVFMVGYQEKINGKNKQVINYVFPDGHIEQAGQWQGGEPTIKEYEVEI